MTSARRSVKRRATARDVARIAGVSISAVSRSFTPGASVSDGVRAKVLEAAKGLGYRPNVMARSMTTRRSQLLAVILATDTNLQYPELLSEIARAASRRHYRLLLFTLDAMSELESTVDQIWAYQVDGVLAAVRLTDLQIQQLEDHGIKVVLFNRAPERRIVSSVSCDHTDCGRRVGELLIETGHRSVGIILGPAASTVAEERAAGLVEVLRAGGVAIEMARGDYSYESGREAMVELGARRRKLTAVTAVSDMMALGAMDAARHGLGLQVPEQLSIVGFDGIRSGRWDSYRLTTIRQPIRSMSDAAAGLLIDRILNPDYPAERRVFPGEIVDGATLKRLG